MERFSLAAEFMVKLRSACEGSTDAYAAIEEGVIES